MAEPARGASALAGVLATAAGLGAAHLVAAVVAPAASPVVAVWRRAVDLTPTPLKEWAGATFGVADKAVLAVGVVVVTLALGAVVGLVGRRSLRAGVAAGGVLAVVALVAAAGSGGFPLWILPSLVAFGVGAWALVRLRAAFLPRSDAVAAGPPRGASRRGLLVAGAVAAGAALTAGLGEWLTRLGGVAATGRLGVAGPTPPVPTGAGTPLPVGLEATTPVSPLFTPNAGFYRIDTAFRVPDVDPNTWTLRIDGMVDRPLTLTWADLVGAAAIERDVTLACVSNDVGGDLIGNARWRGVPTAELLRRVGVQSGADQVLSASVDGFTVSTPLEALTDGRGAMLAYAMNGAPLPAEHGYPVRLLTPGLYGFVGATKWIVSMTLTTYARDAAYWTERGWATKAPILPSSRIEIPQRDQRLASGPVKVGGVAWAHGTGVGRVQVRVDDGEWQDATLGPDAGIMSWRQWVWTWQATPGVHRLMSRVIDAAGRAQTESIATPFPSGATGLHRIQVTVV